MQKLPKNYKKLTAEIQDTLNGTGIFIDSMMFAKGNEFFGYVPQKDITKPIQIDWPNKERTVQIQDCYESLCNITEQYGLTLLLAHFILAEGSTMLMGTAEVIKEYLEKMNKTEDAHAQVSKH